jgi:hypothetical protein
MEALEISALTNFTFLLSEAQPKNAPGNPPSPIRKQMQTFSTECARYFLLNLTFFYNFIPFKLCSTTEQMLALVFNYVVIDVDKECMSKK